MVTCMGVKVVAGFSVREFSCGVLGEVKREFGNRKRLIIYSLLYFLFSIINN